jgi:hypothetical protein
MPTTPNGATYELTVDGLPATIEVVSTQGYKWECFATKVFHSGGTSWQVEMKSDQEFGLGLKIGSYQTYAGYVILDDVALMVAVECEVLSNGIETIRGF